jgi:hypothetical protein
LGNLAICGCSAVEARDLSLAEYDALLIGWGRVHEKDGEADAPDVDFVREQMARLRSTPSYTH